jgi:phosphatidylglycerophosphatase A
MKEKPAAKDALRSFSGVLSTWFGSGLAPKAPGTFGSLAALPFAYPIVLYAGWIGVLFAGLLIGAVGVPIVNMYLKEFDRADDPSEVVIDEVSGMWIALAAVPFTWWGWLLAFVLFRLFDITKPWPVSWADEKLPDGLGVMLDDVLAGIMAIIVAVVIQWMY